MKVVWIILGVLFSAEGFYLYVLDDNPLGIAFVFLASLNFYLACRDRFQGRHEN